MGKDSLSSRIIVAVIAASILVGCSALWGRLEFIDLSTVGIDNDTPITVIGRVLSLWFVLLIPWFALRTQWAKSRLNVSMPENAAGGAALGMCALVGIPEVIASRFKNPAFYPTPDVWRSSFEYQATADAIAVIGAVVGALIALSWLRKNRAGACIVAAALIIIPAAILPSVLIEFLRRLVPHIIH